ncbi:MAG: F0F1 ATP synthase subunit B [Desulfomonile sp.]
MIQLNFTLFIQIANFVVLLLILNAVLYKPIMAKMRDREAHIKKDRDKAQELEKNVQDQEQRHQEELSKARLAASQEKAVLLADAKKVEADVLEKARSEAARIVDEMKASIHLEATDVRKTLKEEMAPLALSISEKILGRSIQ